MYPFVYVVHNVFNFLRSMMQILGRVYVHSREFRWHSSGRGVLLLTLVHFPYDPWEEQDGMVSAEEIAFVVQHVLTAASTAKQAKAIAEEVNSAKTEELISSMFCDEEILFSGFCTALHCGITGCLAVPYFYCVI